MKKIRTAASVSLTLAAALLLTGCAPAEGATDAVDPNASTDWRQTTEQTPVNPKDGGYVDHTDTSRQDGAKEFKFLVRGVESINPVTQDKMTEDKTALMKVTASEITPLGSVATADLFGLKLNASNSLRPKQDDVVGVDLYSVTLKIEYISGFDDIDANPVVPVFWPVTEAGATTYVAASNTLPTFNKSGSTVTFTAATKTGTPAPIGVRYIQFSDNAETILSPVIDVFPQQAAVVTPREVEIQE